MTFMHGAKAIHFAFRLKRATATIASGYVKTEAAKTYASEVGLFPTSMSVTPIRCIQHTSKQAQRMSRILVQSTLSPLLPARFSVDVNMVLTSGNEQSTHHGAF